MTLQTERVRTLDQVPAFVEGSEAVAPVAWRTGGGEVESGACTHTLRRRRRGRGGPFRLPPRPCRLVRVFPALAKPRRRISVSPALCPGAGEKTATWPVAGRAAGACPTFPAPAFEGARRYPFIRGGGTGDVAGGRPFIHGACTASSWTLRTPIASTPVRSRSAAAGNRAGASNGCS